GPGRSPRGTPSGPRSRQMATRGRTATKWAVWAVLVMGGPSLGCYSAQPDPQLCACPVPRELTKVTLPAYVIEPPDILLIDAVQVIPRPPYRAAPLDSLVIQVANTPPGEPITGLYIIEPEGTINLGFGYGSVRVAGLTIDEVKAAIQKHLRGVLKDPQVNVGLGQSRGLQQIRGEHLVRPDGTVGLGTYGAVHVTGMTIPEAKAAIETHLSQYLLDPEIS